MPAARGARDDRVEVGDEFLAGEMAVAINHGGSGTRRSDAQKRSETVRQISGHPVYLTRVPARGLGVHQHRRAAVGAGGEHHAFDTMPIISRGLRLATITIERPTMASGS